MTKSILALALLSLSLTACSKSADQPAGGAAAKEEHTHSEWWCAEHGIPEEECALCDPKVAAAQKAAGDWCAKHDRPDSQCFVCHPDREKHYASLYEAKYGKAPPAREEEKN